MNVGRILTQATREVTAFRRDRVTLGLAFFLPLATLLIYGFAIRLEITQVPVAVQDLDNSPLSRSLVERIFNSDEFSAVPVGSDPYAPLVSGKAIATLIIPPGTARAVGRGVQAPLGLYIDGVQVGNAQLVRGGIGATIAFFTQMQGLQPIAPPLVAHQRIWFNPGRQEALFIVPGVIAVVLALFPPMLSAIAMVRDKEDGTIVLAYASRMNAAE